MLPVVLLYVGGNAVVVFVAAGLSWHGFEKFFVNLRTRFRHPV